MDGPTEWFRQGSHVLNAEVFQCFFIKGKFSIDLIILDFKGREFLDVEVYSFLSLSTVILEHLTDGVVELFPLEQETLNKVTEGNMKELIITNEFPLLKFIVDDEKAPDEVDEVIIVFGEFVDGGVRGIDDVCVFVFDVGGKHIAQKAN